MAFQSGCVTSILAAVVISLLFTNYCGAYEQFDVVNGGTITGKVRYNGQPPGDSTVKVESHSSYCGEWYRTERFIISKSGEVKWAVAMITRITGGKKLNTDTVITVDNEDCRFSPRVMAAIRGAELRLVNGDRVPHRVRLDLLRNDRRERIITIAVPLRGSTVRNKRILRDAGLIALQGVIHPFELGWIWSLPHPYAATTDENGVFTISDVPAGRYSLRIWHEALGEKTLSVTVEPGSTSEVSVVF